MTGFASGNTIAEIAALIGEAARANMLSALMGGKALTAGELALHAGVSAQTTSGHLSKLSESGLIALEKQGRHRYYRLASAEIAHAMEALMTVAGGGPQRHRPLGPKDEAMRTARSCYDHMAGRLGIAIADALSAKRFVMVDDGAAAVTRKGREFFRDFGIDLDSGDRAKRPLCKTCLDWSERRPHLAGWLGAALLERSLASGWVARIPESRALKVTPSGKKGFVAKLGLPSQWMEPSG